jgi:hypothetical protein
MTYVLGIKSERDSLGRWVATLAADTPLKAYGSSASEATARLLGLLGVLLRPDLLPECGEGSVEQKLRLPGEQRDPDGLGITFDRAA